MQTLFLFQIKKNKAQNFEFTWKATHIVASMVTNQNKYRNLYAKSFKYVLFNLILYIIQKKI